MHPDPGRDLSGDRIHPQQASGAFGPQAPRPEGNGGERRTGSGQNLAGPVGARVDTQHGIAGRYPRRAGTGGQIENPRKPEGRREDRTCWPMMCSPAPGAERVPHPAIATARAAAHNTAEATPLLRTERSHVLARGRRHRGARTRVMPFLLIGHPAQPTRRRPPGTVGLIPL